MSDKDVDEHVYPVPLGVCEQHCKCTHKRGDHQGVDSGPCAFCMCPEYEPVGHVYYPTRKNLPAKLIEHLVGVVERTDTRDMELGSSMHPYKFTAPGGGQWTVYVRWMGYKHHDPLKKDDDEEDE